MLSRTVILAGISLLLAATFVAPALAAPTPEQRQKLSAADTALKKAGNLFSAKKFQEAGEELNEAQKLIAELAALNDKDINRLAEPLGKRLKNWHSQLELEGVKLAPLPTLPVAEKPSRGPRISFVKEVAPLLVGKCGRCHINQSRGEFSMATFASLQKGSQSGVVVMPKNSEGSRIVEVIESGDMPRGGGKVTPQELKTLAAWIDGGAVFDGKDPSAPIASLVPAGTLGAPEAPKLEVIPATGKETISFARDIAPVLADNCLVCHGADQPQANFSMATFERFLRGGTSGAPLVTGKPAESLIVRKLKGEAGDRMPLKRPPLAEAVIAKIEKWISEGGTFDSDSARDTLERVVALARARSASAKEITAERAKAAARDWQVALPKEKANEAATANFLVLGNVHPELLDNVAQTAEKQVPLIGRILRAPANAPLMKGRTTLFVFRRRYDYREFGKMVESRDLPADWQGHWRYDEVDAYGCLLLPTGEEELPAGLIAQHIAGNYVANLDKIPRWFSEGVARVVASRLDPKDDRVRQWDEDLSKAVTAGGKPDAFLTGKMSVEEADVVSYSFVKFLMNDTSKFNALMHSLRQDVPFEAAFVKAYGRPPAQLIPNWAAQSSRASR